MDGSSYLTLPLPASCLSQLSRFKSHLGHVRKLPGLVGGFCWVLWSPPNSYNWLVTTLPRYGRKSDEKQNSSAVPTHENRWRCLHSQFRYLHHFSVVNTDVKWGKSSGKGGWQWPAEILYKISPSAAEVTFVQYAKKQNDMKVILTVSCCYSLERSHWVLSHEYPSARVSVIF